MRPPVRAISSRQTQPPLPPGKPSHEGWRRRPSPLTIGLGVGAVGCFAVAVALWTASAVSQRQTASLSPIDALTEPAGPEPAAETEETSGDDQTEASEPSPWEGAEDSYPGLAGWLELENPALSTPVMQATEDAPEWFLDHDAFGNESASGLPYLDFRCTEGRSVDVVYAHNLGWGSSEGFGALADAWRQDVFEDIGILRWCRRSAENRDESAGDDGFGQVVEYRPVCAIKVDGEEPEPFEFETTTSEELAGWLYGLQSRVDAFTEESFAGGLLSHHCLALVTCSGDGYPSRSRTIVLFGDAEAWCFEDGAETIDAFLQFAHKMNDHGDDAPSPSG